MIEPPRFYTLERRQYDLRDLEVLETLFIEYRLHDRIEVRLVLKRLAEEAGTKHFSQDFHILFAYLVRQRVHPHGQRGEGAIDFDQAMAVFSNTSFRRSEVGVSPYMIQPEGRQFPVNTAMFPPSQATSRGPGVSNKSGFDCRHFSTASSPLLPTSTVNHRSSSLGSNWHSKFNPLRRVSLSSSKELLTTDVPVPPPQIPLCRRNSSWEFTSSVGMNQSLNAELDYSHMSANAQANSKIGNCHRADRGFPSVEAIFDECVNDEC